ncbi:MAG: alanine racemase [Clostridia bacterium]|nr:alanine racemase [Clostridia bacterium]
MLKRSWVTVNLRKVKQNYKEFKKLIAPSQKIMAVVKANAYGHGDIKVSVALEEIGCSDFAVSNLNEAVRLRRGGVKGNVLILGYTPINAIKTVKKYNLIQTIISADYLNKILLLGYKISVQFKIETGMNRLGLPPNNTTKNLIENATQKLNVTGIFTHLSCADESDKTDFTSKQIQTFKEFASSLKHLNFTYVHYLNSAGALFFSDGFSTHVRLGISLYGISPRKNHALPSSVKPVLEWKSVIVMLKTINKGESVSYGATFKATKKTVVATVCTGYADGFSRTLSNGGLVIVNGKRAKVIGRVCMDQFMIDVSHIKNVKVGDIVTIVGKDLTACDMAKKLKTIPYEILCRITSRVHRKYIN